MASSPYGLESGLDDLRLQFEEKRDRLEYNGAAAMVSGYGEGGGCDVGDVGDRVGGVACGAALRVTSMFPWLGSRLSL